MALRSSAASSADGTSASLECPSVPRRRGPVSVAHGVVDPGACDGVQAAPRRPTALRSVHDRAAHHRRRPMVAPGAVGVHHYTGSAMDSLDISGAADASGGATSTATDDTLRTLVRVPGNHLMTDLLGPRDELLDLVEDAFPRTAITVRGNEISIVGPDSTHGRPAVRGAGRAARAGPSARGRVDPVAPSTWCRPTSALRGADRRGAAHRPGRPGAAQDRRPEALRRRHRAPTRSPSASAPPAPARRWLAVAMAVQALQAKEVERIILTRPAVEAGERLGFLPGDLMAKVDPYLRPLYDALYDMVGAEGAQRLLERGVGRGRAARLHARAARSTTASSSSTRRRTPRRSR